MTICTRDRMNYFGEIENEEMHLNKIGIIARTYWQRTPEHFLNVKPDEFIIMPNHVHGIIIINNIPVEKAHNSVGNADLRSLQCLEQQNNRSKMYLSKVIHGFKSSVTRTVRKRWGNKNFGWQKSFYEHIIRNDEDLFHTRRYIQDNPAQWALDKNNSQNWRE